MSYKRFDEIRLKYNIKATNWPSGVAFESPSSMASMVDVRRLLDVLLTGEFRFEAMTRKELLETQVVVAAAPKRTRAVRKDANVKRGKYKPRRLTMKAVPGMIMDDDEDDEEEVEPPRKRRKTTQTKSALGQSADFVLFVIPTPYNIATPYYTVYTSLTMYYIFFVNLRLFLELLLSSSLRTTRGSAGMMSGDVRGDERRCHGREVPYCGVDDRHHPVVRW